MNGNTRIKNSILIDNDASVMSSLGVGKVSNDTYPLDVSGIARFSSTVSIDGTATLTSSMSVAGSSTLIGSVGIGSSPTEDDKLFVNGQSRTTGQAIFDSSIAIGAGVQRETDIQGSALLVQVPISSTAASDVTFNVPKSLYTSTDITNISLTNKLLIDAKNRLIRPSVEMNGVNQSVGWDIGATGANRFNRVYGRTLEVSRNAGIGKSSDGAFAMDVVGPTRLSSNLTVGGASTIGSISNITGTSQLTGRVGIGKAAAVTNALDVNGNIMISGNTFVAGSMTVGQTNPSSATLYVNASANGVIFDAPNMQYRAASSSNPSQTNFLEIDTKTRSILPYARNSGGELLNTAATGWNLGGTGAYRFNKIYARDVVISTQTINIEDDSGNKIGMSFDATTGAVNYTVTTVSGEVFLIKGVQTQKNGSGTIDPTLLEFAGLSFGDTFTNDAYDLTSTFTYDLGINTYTGNGTTFTVSPGEQTLESFVSGTNITTLLSLIATGTSVVIKVGATDGRTTSLDGIDVPGSLVSLAGKIISVKNTGASTSKWTLCNSENYINVAGNYLHYAELKNINMASGTYFISNTDGSLVYNSVDHQYIKTADLSNINGDLYLYITRGPGKNWTKIPVSLPKSGTIQTQHIANSAITTTKLADNSVTGDKIDNGSITGVQFMDNSITVTKIADGNITSAKLADGSISGTKLATGAISLANMIADGIITGAKLVAGSIGESFLDVYAVTTDKLATNSVTINKLTDLSVSAGKIIDGSITNSKMATDSVSASNIIANSITGDKIAQYSITGDRLLDGTITAIKLASGLVNSTLIDASSITVDKIASGAITTDKISDLAVTTGKLAATSVTTSKIASGAVTGDKLGSGSVATVNIMDGAITTSKMANAAVTSDQISGAAITTEKIADSAITNAKLNAGSVTVDKIASGAVTTSKIADSAVTTFKLADSAVGTEQMADGAIVNAKLAIGSILAANIGNLEVSTAKIAEGAITSAKIAAGAISNALLDVSIVSTNNIASNAVTAAKIAAGAVTTEKIADASIRTSHLTSSSVTTSNIADGSITAAKLSPNFSIPSTSGTGIGANSDISLNTIATGGKQLSSVFTHRPQLITGTTANPLLVWNNMWTDYGKISGDGSVFICPITTTRVDIYRYNTTLGQFVISESITNTACVGGVEVSNDGNTFITYPYVNSVSWPYIYSYRCFFIYRYISPSAFTGSISGTTLTVTAIASGQIFVGQTISGTGVTEGQMITAFISGTGGVGTYLTSHSQTLSSTSFTGMAWRKTYKHFIPPNSDTAMLNNLRDLTYARILMSPDTTKLLIYMLTGSAYFAGTVIQRMYIVNTSDLSTLVTINTPTGFFPFIQEAGARCMRIPIAWSSDSTRVIVGQHTNDSNKGRAIVFDINYTKIALSSPSLTSTGPSPSYGLTGYTPILMADLPARFRLKNTGTGFYMGMANYGSGNWFFTLNPSIYVNQKIVEFGVDKPSNLYSTTGVNTHRIYAINADNVPPTKNFVVTNGGTPAVLYADTTDAVTSRVAWQMFLKDGTSDQVILWTPQTSTAGNYITVNQVLDQRYSNLYVSTGTPVIFTLEPVNDFTSFNTVTQVGNWVGPVTTGVGSRVGSCVDITSDGQTVVISDGAEGMGGQTVGTVKIYRYVSANNWTLVTNIVGSDIGLTNTLIAGTPNGFGVDLKINSGGTILVIACNGGNEIGMLALYSLINGIWKFVGLNYGRGVSGTFGDKITMSNGGRVIALDPYYGTSVGLAYIFEMVSVDVASKIVSCDALNISTGNLNITPGTDATTGASYTIKNTGAFLNNGGLVIYNSTTPTLTLIGGSATGHSIEFRNSIFTNAWGNTNLQDWRFGLDTYNGYQSMMFQGRVNSATSNLVTLNTTECATWSAIGSPTTSIPLVLSPTNLGVSNAGSYSVISVGSQREINHDISILGTPRMRIIGGRINTGSNYYSAITNELDFEIQTGRAANTELTTLNYLSNRRLHISSAGDVGIGTTAVSGKKLTVDGSVATTGTLRAIKYEHFTTNNTTPLNISSNGGVVFNTGGKTNSDMTIASTGEIGIGITPVTGTKLTVSGNATITGTVTNSSDDRLKDNEVLITNATDTIMKLRPEIYDKKPDFTSIDSSTFYKESGLVAQDIWYGAPELRHLVKLGSRVEFVYESRQIEYPPLVAGVDISGVEYRTVEIPISVIVDASGNPVDVSGNSVDASGNSVDVSGNPIDVSGNPVDASGNPIDVSGNPIDASGNPIDVSGNPIDASGNPVDASGNPIDASGNSVDASGNPIDASGNPVDASGNPVDASGNPVDASGNPVKQTQIIIIDNRPKSLLVTKTIYKPINPADIVEIPLTADVQNDPDYTALGWGDTPASVNYLGLLPYLIKSIQELNSEIDVIGAM
jgi:hypothetical protein